MTAPFDTTARSDRRSVLRLGLGLGVGLAAALLAAPPAGSAEAGQIIDAPQALARSNAGEVILVDIRSPEEWKETGIPKGAKLVTIHNRRGARGFLRDMLKLVGGDKSKPVALICARGNRSARALRFLERNGFTRVYDVSEGLIGRGKKPGWIARKLPIEKCAIC